MSEKRFVYIEHKGADYILDTPNWELDFIEMLGDTLEAEEIVDLLNSLNDENVKLRARNKYLAMKIQRERNIHVKEHEKWENEIQKENEQLKAKNEGLEKDLQETMNIFKELEKENEQLEKRLQIYKSDGLEKVERLQRCYNNSKKAMKTIDTLDEENIQLKKDLDYYKKRIKELEIENQGQSDAIDGLQEMMAHYDLEDLE